MPAEKNLNDQLSPEGADGPLWLALRSRLGVQQVKFLTRFEAHCLARCDRNFRAGSRVAANPRLARSDIENSEAAQLNPVARSKRLLQALEDRVDSRFRFVARQSGLGDHLVDNVLFNQCLYPEG